jgi:hypothetical protein
MKQHAAPLFRPLGFLIAMCLALVVIWPAYLSGGIFYFMDTNSYFHGGEKIWSVFVDAVWPAPQAVSGDGIGSDEVNILSVTDTGRSTVGRSFIYSVFSYLTLTIAGPVGIAFAQATLIVFSFFALIERKALGSPAVLIIGALIVAFLTTLPWHSVYLMPDIFGSVIIIFGAVLVTHFNDLSMPQKIVLTLLAAVATSTHYGNIPVMAAVGGFALVWMLFLRKLTISAIASVVFAVVFSPALNMLGSSMFLETPSAAPLRLPILLARSIDDGPAYWYLTKECETVDFAMCDAFGGEIPDSINHLLWDDDGVKSLSPEVLQRIRDEEIPLLFQVFLDYPVAQTSALLGNTFKQVTKFGTGEISFGTGVADDFTIETNELSSARWLLPDAEPIVTFIASLSFVVMLILTVTGQLTARQRRIFIAVCFGLFVNAAVFGGLSAPVDRYQARAMWLIPALLVVVIARYLSERSSIHEPDRTHANT